MIGEIAGAGDAGHAIGDTVMLRKTIVTVLTVELVLALGYFEVVYLAPAAMARIEQMLDPLARALEAFQNHR
jgi:hypothetical protein